MLKSEVRVTAEERARTLLPKVAGSFIEPCPTLCTPEQIARDNCGDCHSVRELMAAERAAAERDYFLPKLGPLLKDVRAALTPALEDTGSSEPCNVVRLTQAEFDALPEYPSSVPACVTVGKRWRRAWYMGEYAANGEIAWRRIEVAPAPEEGSGDV